MQVLPYVQVLSVYFDCDRDSLIFLSDPIGPACHTNAPTCYFKGVCLLGSGSIELGKTGSGAFTRHGGGGGL